MAGDVLSLHLFPLIQDVRFRGDCTIWFKPLPRSPEVGYALSNEKNTFLVR